MRLNWLNDLGPMKVTCWEALQVFTLLKYCICVCKSRRASIIERLAKQSDIRVSKTLDIGNITRQLRQFQSLTKVLLDNEQRALLRMQRRVSALEAGSSSDDDWHWKDRVSIDWLVEKETVSGPMVLTAQTRTT